MITMSSMLELGWLRRWRIIAAALAASLLLGLGGCSTVRLAYNQADRMMYWWLDGYVGFTSAQAPLVRDAVAGWFDWNRHSQLPDYAGLLELAAQEMLQDTTPARMCEWVQEIRVRLDRAVQQALPPAAVLAVGFDAGQFDRLEKRHAEAVAELQAEYLKPEPAARQAAAVERLRERAEKLYGRLDVAQRERLERGVAESPFDAERWLAERERRQRDIAQSLRSVAADAAGSDKPSAGSFGQPLHAMWQRVKRSPDAAYRRYQDELIAYNCALSADVHNSTTAEQRQTAQRQLRAWRLDLLQLASPG